MQVEGVKQQPVIEDEVRLIRGDRITQCFNLR